MARKKSPRTPRRGTTLLSTGELSRIQGPLARANRALDRRFPGESTRRQPVHTVYGGAHLFKAETARKMGDVALRALASHAPDGATLAQALGYMGGEFAQTVYLRMCLKLEQEPVEDFRIDFEDGYGHRPNEEEDAHAEQAARELARGLGENTLPPFIGIRIKPFSNELFARSARTLELFLRTLLKETGGALPPSFIVTLPKVQSPAQVSAAHRLLTGLEKRARVERGTIELELMVETPQAILSPEGTSALPALVGAAEGRCRGVHFGTYDYTAACGITAGHQTMDHPACDFAKHLMQVSLAGTGVHLSDGATNAMPVGPHRGESLTSQQEAENRAIVHRAWRLQYGHIRHSLSGGFYQGWDLHPAQLPVRYAAVYSFFLEQLATASLRLRSFMEKAAQANRVGDVFDDAATGQGLLNFFLRGLSCGALTEDETRATGLTLEELRLRSFAHILEGRR